MGLSKVSSDTIVRSTFSPHFSTCFRESKTLAIDGSKYPNVMRFGEELAGHTLDVLGVSVSRTDFLEKHLGCKDDGQDLLRFFDRFMSDKKMHEVSHKIS